MNGMALISKFSHKKIYGNADTIENRQTTVGKQGDLQPILHNSKVTDDDKRECVGKSPRELPIDKNFSNANHGVAEPKPGVGVNVGKSDDAILNFSPGYQACDGDSR